VSAVDVRRAEPRDADAVAGVHVRSWQVGYRGLIDDGVLDALNTEERASRYTFGLVGPPVTVLAEEAGAVLGFATIGAATGPGDSGTGELLALYVDPARWRTGVGRALIASAREQLVRWRYTSAVLWVLQGNERAQRFYAADGWAADGSRRTAEIWGVTVHEVRYRRPLP